MPFRRREEGYSSRLEVFSGLSVPDEVDIRRRLLV